MEDKEATIEDLAQMIQKERLENIEKLIFAEHNRRIERLEVEVKELKDALAIK